MAHSAIYAPANIPASRSAMNPHHDGLAALPIAGR
jgi:hypothetical protein